MAKRLKWNEVSLDDDIRYRGPISFQGFQALGWLCMVVEVALALLKFASKVNQPTAEMTKNVLPVLRTVSSPLPALSAHRQLFPYSQQF